MKTWIPILFILFSLCLSKPQNKCYEIKKNKHYSSPHSPWGLNTQPILSAKIKLDSSASQYLVPNSNSQVKRCMGSWNKLFGASRCFTHHHIDSDRFVWKRARSCLNFTDEGVYEIPDCKDKGKLEIAAYAYDDWEKPYQHSGTLEKEFQTLVETDIWYTYTITFEEEQSIYTLADENGNTLEEQVIEHSKCWNSSLYDYGYLLGFYFGGVCKAPQPISACYEYE